MKWTPSDLKKTRLLVNQGLTNYNIAQILGCTTAALECKMRRENIVREHMQQTGIGKNKRYKHQTIATELIRYFQSAKQVYDEYKDIYSNIKLKSKKSKSKQIEEQVLLLSDMHTGMINKAPITGEITYDESIQEKELQTLVQGIFRFYELYQASYNITRLHIFALGDLITNDRIFEGQQTEITCQTGEQIIKCFNYLSDMLKKLLEIYPEINLIMQYGNHGRTTSNLIVEDPKSNFEYLLGLLLKERFANNERINIILPDDYAYEYRIFGHRYLLTHGNMIRGGTLNSIEKAAKEIALLVEEEYYDVITIGHFHSCQELSISPSTTMIVNGCFINKDSYAYNKLRKFSTAKQVLFNVSKRSAYHNLQKIELIWD